VSDVAIAGAESHSSGTGTYFKCKFEGEFRGHAFSFDDAGINVPRPGERIIDSFTSNYYQFACHKPKEVVKKDFALFVHEVVDLRRRRVDVYEMQLKDEGGKPMMGTQVQERFESLVYTFSNLYFTFVRNGTEELKTFKWVTTTSPVGTKTSTFNENAWGLFYDFIGYTGLPAQHSQSGVLITGVHHYFAGTSWANPVVGNLYPPAGTAVGVYVGGWTFNIYFDPTTHVKTSTTPPPPPPQP